MFKFFRIQLLPMLDNREVVTVIIISLIVIILLIFKRTRSSLHNLVKAALSYKLLIIFLLAISYIILSIILLLELGFWNSSLVKETIIWTSIGGLPLVTKTVQSKDISIFFKSTILDNFKILVTSPLKTGAFKSREFSRKGNEKIESSGGQMVWR